MGCILGNIPGRYPGRLNVPPQKIAKTVFAHPADQRRFPAQAGSHGQHVGGRAAGIAFQVQRAVRFGAYHIHQALTQCHNVIPIAHSYLLLFLRHPAGL